MSRSAALAAIVALAAATACGRLGFDRAAPAGGDDTAADDAADDAPPTCRSGPDEDADGFADACDVCPHVSDPTQTDRDGDGVGDVCDPEPDLARQRILFFDGFNAADPAWEGGGTVAAGQMQIDVLATDSSEQILVPTSLVAWRIAGTIDAVGDVTQKPQLFLGTYVDATTMYYVEMIDEGAGRRRSLMRNIANTFTELDGIQEATPITAGPLDLTYTVAPDRLDASIATASATTISLAAPGVSGVAGPKMLLYVNAMAIRLDYAIAISTTP